MRTLCGISASTGVAFGRLKFYRRGDTEAERLEAEDPAAELRRYEDAKEQAAAQLAKLCSETKAKIGEENALLFEIHKMMLEDLDFVETVTALILEESCNAEYAVTKAGRDLAQSLASTDDEYMQARAADVLDVAGRLRDILRGVREPGFSTDCPVILAAEDLLPSETAQLDKKNVLAIVTAAGSPNSHAAIFARSMGIPAIICLGEDLNFGLDGEQVAVNAGEGIVYVTPDSETVAALQNEVEKEQNTRAALEIWRGRPTATSDGKPILLYANIGSPNDLDAVLQNDAEGIGLFRSEFLYLGRSDFPDEKTQLAAYRTVAQRMDGKRVVIRTLDIGADKQLDYFHLPKEENPALGMRAIRICLSQTEVFKTQLRALYRASAFGKIAIMFPMITSQSEVAHAKQICGEVQSELAAQGVAFDRDTELGIMVETPAAAMLSDLLAPMVDFFSIGTNDLIQYTLAADRQNPGLSSCFDAHSEAVMRLMEITVKNAHMAGIWCGICGELGAEHGLTERLLKMGLDEFSVAPPQILPLREKIAQFEAGNNARS